MTMAEV